MKKKLFVLLLSMFAVTSFNQSNAQDALIGEVKMFAGNFAPRGWALCEGQLLPIQSYQALFSILGTTYGGDGRTTFALPDLRGRTPIGPGTGPGLSTTQLGQKKGSETTTLNTQNLPIHAHQIKSEEFEAIEIERPGDMGHGTITVISARPTGIEVSETEQVGGNLAANNMQPSLGMNYIICLNGIFPSRN